jgi:outer membrane receptor protein involved in Fe transport
MFAAWDPARCPNPDPDFLLPPFVGCILESFEYVTSGNQELNPEQSESVSVGFTAVLWKGLSVSANYWSIEHTDKIASPDLNTLLANENLFGTEFIERNPPLPEDIDLGRPGNIERINNRFVNLASHDVSGVDIDANFDVELAGLGTLSTRLLWTRLDSIKYALNPGDVAEELAGTYGHPENRASLDTYLNTENWLFGIYGRWTDGYEDTANNGNVASHIEWDVQVSNFNFNGIRLTLGVENIFDNVPPFSVGDFNPQGFNTQFYSMRGRMIYGRATLTF